MLLEYWSFIAEEDAAFTRGAEINWEQFQINLAAHAAATGNNLQRLDAIMWLGIAGHPEAPTMAQPTRISIGADWLPSNAEAAFSETLGITMNPRLYPTLNLSGQQGEDVAEALSHELRHRGFRIIGDIPILLQRLPAEYQDAIRSPNSGSVLDDPEHSMIYAMDGISVDDDPRPVDAPNDPDVRRWRQEYAKCNSAVRGWLADQPIPRGAPEALRRDLERIYGRSVEFVEPGETPVTPPEAVQEEEAVVIVVPPRVADQADKPDLSSFSTTRDNTLARQSRGTQGSHRGTTLLQQALNYLGADPKLEVDGKYGPATRRAVRAFQEQHGLKVDGLAGPETMGKIRELLGQSNPNRNGEQPTPAPTPDTSGNARPTPAGGGATVIPPSYPGARGDITTFRPWRDQLRQAGYLVSANGRAVRTRDWATVAGIDRHGNVWFSDRTVRNIVMGHRPGSEAGSRDIGHRPEDNIYIDR